MRKILLVMCVLAAGIKLSAQVNTGVKFSRLVHDFGNIKEESDSVYTIFSFRNIGTEPVTIVKVETSCGCTTPQFTKGPIKPGDTGFVKAIYHTRGRSKDFYKNLFVHFDKEAYYTSLAIKGYVIEEANLAKRPSEFSTTYSNLAFTSTMAYFPSILKTQKQNYMIRIYNYMGYAIRIYDIKNKPDYVTLDFGDSLIDIEDTLTITVTVDGSKMTDDQFGDMVKPISFYTDDPGAEVKFIYVRTNLKEDFSKISNKTLKNAPRIHMDTMGPLNFGKHSAGERFSYTIKITNTGKQDLNIRRIDPSCSCVSFKLAKQILKPGESVDLVLTIDTLNQMKAELIKYVTILSNDPTRPEIKLKLILTVTS